MFESSDHYKKQREEMVRNQIERRGVRDSRILQACRDVERHVFVMPQDRESAYEDCPLPIGFGQTISQPYMVAYMAEQLQLKDTDIVLEIGTGSGYSAAIIAQIARKVYTMEIVKELYERTSQLLLSLHHKNIVCLLRDGYQGLPEYAPFDKIILTAAPPRIPQPLLDQLKVGGLLIAPLGSLRLTQRLSLFEKLGQNRFHESELMGVSFVEMLRESEREP